MSRTDVLGISEEAGESRRERSKVVRLLALAAALSLLPVLLLILPWILVSTWSEETRHEVLSPDRAWVLVVDSIDSGVLGGSTDISVRPNSQETEDTELTLVYEGRWLADSEVRWVDDRTITAGERLIMPFVRGALRTGSRRTTGANTDVFGYAQNTIAPRERVTMLSGLSFVLPDDLAGELLTRRKPAATLPWQEVQLHALSSWPSWWRYNIMATRSPRETLFFKNLRQGELLGKSGSGDVEVRWLQPAGRNFGRIVVITRLPGKMLGIVEEQRVRVGSLAQARRRADRLWEQFSIEGAELPWVAR